MANGDITHVQDRDGVTVVRIRKSSILNAADVEAFGQELSALADTPGRKVVISFLGVDHLTSTALGKLIAVHQRLQAKGGDLKLADIDPRVYEVFSITRLDKLFDIHDRAETAVESFES